MLPSPIQGEGWGEGKIFSCPSDNFALLTSPCPLVGHGRCAKNPLGPKSGSGGCCARAAWQDTNSDANIRRDNITSISFVSKPRSQLNWTVQVMAFPVNSNMTTSGMLSWPRAAFLSNEYGIIGSPNWKAGRTSWKIFGASCRSEHRTRRMWRCCLPAANRISLKNPHPDPLPSDGRGEAAYILPYTGRGSQRQRPFKMLPLSHPMEEGPSVVVRRRVEGEGKIKRTENFNSFAAGAGQTSCRTGRPP